MDMGVGAFVFSQGIVSAIPLLKASLYSRAPLSSEIASVVVKCAPVLAIGLVRVVLVKGTVSGEFGLFFFWLIKLLVNKGTR
jgi:phosphatidylinositol glycan class W